MFWRSLLWCGLIAACTPVERAEQPPQSRAKSTTVQSVQFPAKVYPRGVARSNLVLAQDFLELTFAVENGRPLERLLRYEGPVNVIMADRALAPYQRDLDYLLNRLRREAGIPIKQVSDPAKAQIHIVAVPSSEIQKAYPGAACFIIPGETNWQEYRSKSRRQRLYWSEQLRLGQTAIFIPSDSTPQDTRDCLHEEIAQTLGPGNDVYRLHDTVFNDDNFHSILTPFDMLVLRALYHPDLRTGMSKQRAAAEILPILNQINPKGRGVGQLGRTRTSRDWDDAIDVALNGNRSNSSRLRAATKAVSIAQRMQPIDHRLGVALLTRGRLRLKADPQAGSRDITGAYNNFNKLLGTNDVRTAQAALHLAILALGNEDFAKALKYVEQSIEPALYAQNAILASGLYAVQTEALIGLGETPQVRDAWLNSLKWRRLAFGDTNGEIADAQARLEQVGPSRNAAENRDKE